MADTTIQLGDIQTLPVYLNPNGGNTVGAFSTQITYDSTKIDILSCTPITFTGACNIGTTDSIQLAGIHTTGVQTNTQIASIQIKANSSVTGVTKLTPNTSLIGNIDGIRLNNIDDNTGDVTISLASPEYAVFIPILQAP